MTYTELKGRAGALFISELSHAHALDSTLAAEAAQAADATDRDALDFAFIIVFIVSKCMFARSLIAS
jgi:hypothetical protein